MPERGTGSGRLGAGLGRLRARMAAGWNARDVDAWHAYDPARPLCLMHIPKTAGTSLIASLSAVIAPETSVTGFDRVLFGGFTNFAALDEALRGQVYDDAGTLPKTADFVAGHFSHSSLRAAYPRGQLLTVLREPATRLLSLWMFWRRHSDEHLAGWADWGDLVRQSRLPLAAFLAERRLAAQLDNVAVRMLLWPHRLIPADGFIDAAHDATLLRQARRRLADFVFVELAEAEDLWARLSAWLGRDVGVERRNEAARIPPGLQVPLAAELDAKCLALLDARSRLDLALWQSIAVARGLSPEGLRRRTLVQHVARYATLMVA